MTRDELVREMMEAFIEEGEWEWVSITAYLPSMAATLDVAVGELLKEVSEEEIDASDLATNDYKRMPDHVVQSRRSQYLKPKTLEERVQIERVPDGCFVTLDGARKRPHFDNDIEAEIYRLGLIEKLRKEEGK